VETAENVAGVINNLLDVGSNEALATDLEQNNVSYANRYVRGIMCRI